MNDNEKKTGFKWFEKLKKIKHIEIYIAVIFIVILLLIYMSNFSKKDTTNNDSNTSGELTISQYIDGLETNLEDILSNIGGVSNVKVMITLDMQQAEVNESNIVLNSFPPIKGVVVTAKDVNDVSNKMKVLHAVEAVIDIKTGSIEILSSE